MFKPTHLALSTLAAVATAGAALAQNWPARPVTMVVPVKCAGLASIDV